MASEPDAPGPLEVRLAYATAVLASFAWVACVMPGVRLADPAVADDFAAPMGRGAIYLVPALLLLVATPVAVVLSRHPFGLRGLLAWSGAFVALYTAVALASTGPRGFAWLVVATLAGLGALAVRDGLAIGRAASEDLPLDMAPRTADARLAACLLALLAPAGLLAAAGEERATWLAPFAYLALGAGAERFAHGLRTLRIAAVGSLLALAAHLVVGVRFALSRGAPEAAGWTAWGAVAFALALAVAATTVAWLLTIVLTPRREPRAVPA